MCLSYNKKKKIGEGLKAGWGEVNCRQTYIYYIYVYVSIFLAPRGGGGDEGFFSYIDNRR